MIHIVGIGPGSPELLTGAGAFLIEGGRHCRLEAAAWRHPPDNPAERKLLPSQLAELEAFCARGSARRSCCSPPETH